MDREQYDKFTQKLLQNLKSDSRVIGFVVLGSTANLSHKPDEWSDHDFFVITKTNTQEHFRQNYDWLPDHDRIALVVRETEHGLKILYDDGHLLEFAIFDLQEIQLARINDYFVMLDRGGIFQVISEIARRSVPRSDTTRRDLGMFVCLLLIGAGRFARGEHLSAHAFIKNFALGHLLDLLAKHLPSGDKSALDNLDPLRRFEQTFPVISLEINRQLRLPVIDAARGLLTIFELHLSDLPDYPTAAIPIVHDVLNRVGQKAI